MYQIHGPCRLLFHLNDFKPEIPEKLRCSSIETISHEPCRRNIQEVEHRTEQPARANMFEEDNHPVFAAVNIFKEIKNKLIFIRMINLILKIQY
jgi:hypothetical protein